MKIKTPPARDMRDVLKSDLKQIPPHHRLGYVFNGDDLIPIDFELQDLFEERISKQARQNMMETLAKRGIKIMP